MANTYVAIATVTVGSGGASSIDFTSIPATYTDLLCVLSHRSNGAVAGSSWALGMKINGVTTNRTYRRLEGFDGTNVASDNGSTDLVGLIQGDSSTASTFGSLQVYIPNYAGSNNKSYSVEGVTENNSSTGNDSALIAGLWSQTSAITDLSFYNRTTADGFKQYTTATLYGIKNS
jgi:hypothetical protein